MNKRSVAIVLCCVVLGACGQTGELYLPPPSAEPSSEQDTEEKRDNDEDAPAG